MRIKQNFAVLVCCVLFLSFLSASAFGAVFDVTDTSGFATALTTAATNGESDTINVAAGTYDVTSILTYTSTEAFTLTIQGAGADDTILKGGDDQIMSISAFDTVTVDGITFLNGKGTSGGGLYVVITNTDLNVTNCVFQGNYAELGGGAYVNSAGTSQGTITFDNNVFMLNQAVNSGGGLYAIGGTQYNYELILTNNLFWGNEANSFHGGGAYVLAGGYTGAASIIAKNTFRYNYAGGDGGGLYAELGSYRSLSQYGGTVTNNLFLNNWAESDGGGAYFSVNISGTAKIINNTCIDNSASAYGGGFYFYLRDNLDSEGWDVTAHINNNIIGDNDAGMADGVDFYVNDHYLPSYSAVATVSLNNNDYPATGRYIVNGDNLTEAGNINDNPNIVAWGDLASDSPCIDAGTASYAPDFDIHGEVRPNDGVIDIGADEFYDTDEDGLPDYWETLTGETEPGADPDEDGMDNLTEYERGLDPIVPVYDASGEWDITVSSVETDCPDMDIEDATVTITQEEGNITLEVDGEIFAGEFNGFDSTYYLGNVETEEGLTITFRMAFSLTTESSGSGTISWIITDESNDLVCDGSAEFTMEPTGSDGDDDKGFCFIQTAR